METEIDIEIDIDIIFQTGPNILVWDDRGGARTALDYAMQSNCDIRLIDLFQLRGAYHNGKGNWKGRSKTRASL